MICSISLRILLLPLVGSFLLTSCVSDAQETKGTKSVLRINRQQAEVLQSFFALCDENSESDLHKMHTKFLPILLVHFSGSLAWASVNPHGPPNKDAVEVQKILEMEIEKLFGERDVNYFDVKSERWSKLERDKVIAVIKRLDAECKKRDFMQPGFLVNPFRSFLAETKSIKVSVNNAKLATVTLTSAYSVATFEFTKVKKEWLLSNFNEK